MPPLLAFIVLRLLTPLDNWFCPFVNWLLLLRKGKQGSADPRNLYAGQSSFSLSLSLSLALSFKRKEDITTLTCIFITSSWPDGRYYSKSLQKQISGARWCSLQYSFKLNWICSKRLLLQRNYAVTSIISFTHIARKTDWQWRQNKRASVQVRYSQDGLLFFFFFSWPSQ